MKQRILAGKTRFPNEKGDRDESSLCVRLKNVLQKNKPHFGNYQELPSRVRHLCPDIKYKKSQLSLDFPRWEFLMGQMRLDSVLAVEVGCNLGYFCLQIAQQQKCRAVGYEPVGEFVEAAGLMAKMLDVTDRCQFFEKSISLRNVKSLPQANLYIELNVLHHGGALFDVKRAAGSGGWQKYAVERLKRMRKRSERLLFQTGNSRGTETLFSPASSILTIRRILEDSGWNPVAVGFIADLDSMKYKIFSPREFHHIPLYRCLRNSSTGLVEYWAGGKIVAELATGLAARPIWFCV